MDVKCIVHMDITTELKAYWLLILLFCVASSDCLGLISFCHISSLFYFTVIAIFFLLLLCLGEWLCLLCFLVLYITNFLYLLFLIYMSVCQLLSLWHQCLLVSCQVFLCLCFLCDFFLTASLLCID